MNNSLILLGLHECPGIGWKTIQLIVSELSNLQDAFDYETEDWVRLGLHPSKAKQIVSGLSRSAALSKAERNRECGVRAITYFDDDYPELLRQIADPPWVLYAKGKLELASRLCIGVVGTRTPTVYGQRAAESLSRELSSYGLCIVSGLARGIDACAHVGALQDKGGTIGVLGCGITEVYPSENRHLFRRIEEDGLLLSEYAPGVKAHPGLFPMRNRIIAGLSLGVLVVEAAARSGSLITADMALEASRDVYAVPGSITSPKSIGTLELIKSGAKLVTSAKDVLEEYAHLIQSPSAPPSRQDSVDRVLTADELKVIGLLGSEPVSFDRLLEQSQFTFGHLHAVLLSLLVKKRIEQVPGFAYLLT